MRVTPNRLNWLRSSDYWQSVAGARGAAQQTFLVVRAVTARDYSQADLLWLFRFLLLLLFLAIQILYTNLFLFFFLVHFSFCFCLVCAAFLAQQVQGNYIFLLNECSLVGFVADVGDWGVVTRADRIQVCTETTQT